MQNIYVGIAVLVLIATNNVAEATHLRCSEHPFSLQKEATLEQRYVEIDGSKNPELIPDYLLWGSIFRFFSAEAGMSAAMKHTLETKELPMPPDDYAVLRVYAERHTAALNALRPRLHKLQSAYASSTQKPEKDKITTDHRQLELEHRYDVLALSDEMLERLTDEGRALLAIWATGFKSGISTTVAKSDMAFFMSPR